MISFFLFDQLALWVLLKRGIVIVDNMCHHTWLVQQMRGQLATWAFALSLLILLI